MVIGKEFWTKGVDVSKPKSEWTSVKSGTKQKGRALATDGEPHKMDDLQHSLELLVKRFNKTFKHNVSGPKRFDANMKTVEEGNSTSRGDSRDDSQCHECKGYGHFKRDCPTLKTKKIKCYECKGFGHTHHECIPDKKKTKGKPMLGLEVSDSDEIDEENNNIFVTFAGISKEPEDADVPQDVANQIPQVDSDSESDVDVEQEYQRMCKQVLDLSKVNIQQREEILLQKTTISSLESELKVEREKNRELHAEYIEQYKKVKMLIGTKTLDQILSEQRHGNVNYGLGYNGVTMTSKTTFVKGGMHEDELKPRSAPQPTSQLKSRTASPPTSQQNKIYRKDNSDLGSCFVCGSFRHFKVDCPEHRARVSRAIRQRKVFYDGKNRNRGWVAKADLDACATPRLTTLHGASGRTIRRRRGRARARQMRASEPRFGHLHELYNPRGSYTGRYDHPRRFWDEEYGLGARWDDYHWDYHTCCHMAVQMEPVEEDTWYFDSGCSRHMTGTLEHLYDVKDVKGGKVTFGGGTTGQIKGKGKTTLEQQPQLMNVYFVEGLRANLISVSQLCDQGLRVVFTKVNCEAIDQNGVVTMRGIRSGNNCYVWKKPTESHTKYLTTAAELGLWHQKLGHMNTRTITTLVKQGSVRGVPALKHEEIMCVPCKKGKQIKVQHKEVLDVQNTSALDLIHMDLIGPMQTESIGGKRYVLVLVDDFSRFTWVRFVREKSETVESFRIWALQLMNQRGGIKVIRSGHGGEFYNKAMDEFCEKQGIAHQFPARRTPEQNGVVECKNRILQEMAHAMVHGNQIPLRFWAEAINTACYIINRVYIRKGTTKTSFELWKGKIPNLSYFHVFGCRVYILNENDNLGEFNSRSDEGFFLGYSETSPSFRVYNKRTKAVEESINVVFDDAPNKQQEEDKWVRYSESDSESDSDEERMTSEKRDPKKHEEGIKISDTVDVSEEKSEDRTSGDGSADVTLPQVHRNHSLADVIGDIHDGRRTRGIVRDYKAMAKHASLSFQAMVMFGCVVSKLEPTNHVMALEDDYGMDSGPLLVYCDNKSAIDISKNLVQHSRTKHIDIRHHVIRELVEDKKVVIGHVVTELKLADLIIKLLDLNWFVNLHKAIEVCEH